MVRGAGTNINNVKKRWIFCYKYYLEDQFPPHLFSLLDRNYLLLYITALRTIVRAEDPHPFVINITYCQSYRFWN